MRNYFKSITDKGNEGKYFFFESGVKDSIQEAFNAALAHQKRCGQKGFPFLFKAERVVGEWNLCNIVGHLPKTMLSSAVRKAKEENDLAAYANAKYLLDALIQAQAA